MELASVLEPATSSSEPIRGQLSGHVICLDQSEERTATSSSVNPSAMAPSENAERWFVNLLSSSWLKNLLQSLNSVFSHKNSNILFPNEFYQAQGMKSKVMVKIHYNVFSRYEHLFRISKKPSDDKDSEYVLKWGGHNTQLLELFSDLLSANTFTDVSLEAESKTFHAHQLVLSACSPYFRSLFITSQASHQTVFCKVTFSRAYSYSKLCETGSL